MYSSKMGWICLAAGSAFAGGAVGVAAGTLRVRQNSRSIFRGGGWRLAFSSVSYRMATFGYGVIFGGCRAIEVAGSGSERLLARLRVTVATGAGSGPRPTPLSLGRWSFMPSQSGREAPLLALSAVSAVVLRSRRVGCAGSPFTDQLLTLSATTYPTSRNEACGQLGGQGVGNPPVVGTTDTRQGFPRLVHAVVHWLALHSPGPFMPSFPRREAPLGRHG